MKNKYRSKLEYGELEELRMLARMKANNIRIHYCDKCNWCVSYGDQYACVNECPGCLSKELRFININRDLLRDFYKLLKNEEQ